MTVDEMINEYNIQLHGDDQFQVSVPKKMSKAEINALKAELAAAKPAILAELISRRDAEIKAREDATARLTANVPGLQSLRDALTRQEMYLNAFDRMMEDESNDGANPPKKPADDINTLKAQYPVAAAYLKAESWEYGSHYAKCAAGRKAKQAIADGADYVEAIAQMDAEWSAYCKEHAWD